MTRRSLNVLYAFAATAVVLVMSSPAWPGDAVSEHAVLDRINRVRLEYGLPPLAYAGDDVREVARSHSQRMLENGFFAHRDDLGRSAGDRLTDSGVSWEAVAENLIEDVGDAPVGVVVGEAVETWTASPGHRANILSPRYTLTAVGIARRQGRAFLTQLFIRR